MSDGEQASAAPGAVDTGASGRVVFRARRPAVLVVPLAVVTEVAGVLSLLNGATIGWFICAAPAFALITTGLILRPTLELTREGLLQRQYPFSTLTRWEVIDAVGLTRAGNRHVLGYRLAEGIPHRDGSPPRRCCALPSVPSTAVISSIRWRRPGADPGHGGGVPGQPGAARHPAAGEALNGSGPVAENTPS